MGKIANYKKKNIEKQGKLQELFVEDAILLEKALNSMNSSLKSYCCNEFEQSLQFCKETIKIEEMQDSLRDEIISRIFGSESMVFSRPDRMRIVTALDRIVGQAKKVVHSLDIYIPENFDRELVSHILAISDKIADMGKMTKEITIEFFLDFDTAIETCIKINETRHGVRERKSEFFKSLYLIRPPYYEFRFFAELMDCLAEVSNRMEHFADFVYGLIAKYSTF